MKDSNPREISFNGVCLRFDSNKSFDEVLSSLLADVGDKPLPINEIAAKFESWDSYRTKLGMVSCIALRGSIATGVICNGERLARGRSVRCKMGYSAVFR